MKSLYFLLVMMRMTSAWCQEHQYDSDQLKNEMPNGMPLMKLLTDKLYNIDHKDIYRLPGGMACVTPDSTVRFNMPSIRKKK